jgi:hypothetical protein
MGKYRFDLSVQIRHPDADLAPVAAAIGQRPKWIWKRGERKQTPEGEFVGDVMSSSYCTFDFEFGTGDDLNRAIVAAVRALEPARALLEELREIGW